MPNVFKYSPGGSGPGTLKKGGFLIGNNTADYGLTYYTGITPPSGGYTIYLNKSVGGPSIYTTSSDLDLIGLTNYQIAGSPGSPAGYTTVSQCFDYFNSQQDKLVINREIPEIPTSDLRIHIDPGMPISYPTQGSSFYDISQTGYTGTLYNNVSFVNTGGNGAFSFDGTDDYGVITDTTPSWLTGDPSFTICGLFKKNGDWTSGGVWGVGGNSGGINSWNSNNTSEITIDYWGGPTYTTGQQYSLTDWKFCAWRKISGTFNKTNISIFVNTVEYTGNNLLDVRSGTRNVNIGAGGVNLAIAGPYESYYRSKSVIGMFSVYSKALSNQEISQYYNSIKSRFGL